jgi:8-oxo-dGTP pyrophosphatase MutT (NUDIX family)
MLKSKSPKTVLPVRGTLQYAALPVRAGASGALEVLLITSRDTRRWIIPKGWPIHKLAPAAAAAREAFEEAGIEGVIRPATPIGHYPYTKALEDGARIVEVAVYLLWVERQRKIWPERAERETRWFSREEAAQRVAEPELAAILRALPGKLVERKQKSEVPPQTKRKF